jgi:hypothetical protein
VLIKLIKYFTGAKRDLYNISTSGATDSQGGRKMAHRKKPFFPHTVSAKHNKFDTTYTNYPTYDTKLILEKFR